MTDATATLPLSPPLPAAGRAVARRPRPVVVDVLAAAAGVGLGVTVGLGVVGESAGSLRAAGGVATASGRLTGLVGTYLMLIVLLLVARVPALERAVGQDRLVRWHRRLGPWPLVLLGAHGALICVGYAQQARTGVWHELGVLLGSYPGVLAATVGFGLLVMAGVTSARIARRRMSHETWWSVHLYTYLAAALSFSHQLATGAAFVGHPATRTWWTILWLGTAGLALVYRVGLPLWRSARHQLRVVDVRPEAPGVVSLILRGRAMDRLAVAGGQFFQWRILKPGLWWQAHPYSISALPHGAYLRVTVKDLGDHSRALAALTPGTRVAVEGPYGAFTAHARGGDRVLLIGAGVGTTPIRALLEDLPRHVDTQVIVRGSTADSVVLGDELAALAARRGAGLHVLAGPRSRVAVDHRTLRRLVADVADRDIYVCGPAGFTAEVLVAARRLGVPEHHLHHEDFQP
ncbi:MAG: putative ferric reductase [Solirubrobacterales bacterium]|nr:putative ferric reductase [Solirubrobacterales bacterium]